MLEDTEAVDYHSTEVSVDRDNIAAFDRKGISVIDCMLDFNYYFLQKILCQIYRFSVCYRILLSVSLPSLIHGSKLYCMVYKLLHKNFINKEKR